MRPLHRLVGAIGGTVQPEDAPPSVKMPFRWQGGSGKVAVWGLFAECWGGGRWLDLMPMRLALLSSVSHINL